jgi:hypothetical protein
MRIHSSKHQWTSLPYGQTSRNELASWWTEMHRRTGSLGLDLIATLGTGFFPFAVVSGCIIFLLGLSLSKGVAVGVLYVSIVLMGLWSPQRYAARWIAGGGTVLLMVGFAVSTDDRSTVSVMIDRTFALMSLWLVAVVSHLHNQHSWDRDHVTGDLAKGLAQAKTLQRVVPICVSCNRVHDEHDRSHGGETYLEAHPDTVTYQVSCPDCRRMRPATRTSG